MEGADQGSDRRADDRHITYYPINLDRGSGPEIVLIHDLSTSGALLYTRGKLEMGAAVKLHLDLPGDPQIVPATVVRAERRSPDVSDVWTYSVGVQFDAVLGDIEPAIEELARKVKAAAR